MYNIKELRERYPNKKFLSRKDIFKIIIGFIISFIIFGVIFSYLTWTVIPGIGIDATSIVVGSVFSLIIDIFMILPMMKSMYIKKDRLKIN